jgi:predicted 2-oxoglutarate/Fe(II)-dependent dioxygenase YbiX
MFSVLTTDMMIKNTIETARANRKSSEPTKITKQKGLVAAFPSYVLHRVTPVTRGVRKTIVVWLTGPRFK